MGAFRSPEAQSPAQQTMVWPGGQAWGAETEHRPCGEPGHILVSLVVVMEAMGWLLPWRQSQTHTKAPPAMPTAAPREGSRSPSSSGP